MPVTVKNDGSACRDYCMLERNLLAHFKLALLLSLISSSVLLHVKITPGTGSTPKVAQVGDTTMASVQAVASLGAIVAGIWEYYYGIRDYRNMRAFLVSTTPHLGILTAVCGVVIATCIILLVQSSGS